MPAKDKVYIYRISKTVTFAGFVCLVGAAHFLARKAMSSHGGLVINHILPLSAGQATVLYWALAAGSLCTALLCGYAFIVSFLVVPELRLSERSISFPKGQKRVSIPYGEIDGVALSSMRSVRVITIHQGIKKHNITSAGFKKRAEFDDFLDEMKRRINSLS
jgi:hypothetical protein